MSDLKAMPTNATVSVIDLGRSGRQQRSDLFANARQACERHGAESLLLTWWRWWWWRGDADLLQQCRGILDVPHFNDLAVGNPVHRHSRPGHLPSRRSDAVEGALMRPVKGHSGHHFIPLSDLI